MLHSILPTCLLLATSAPQDSAHLVDAMIARSNDLKSFVATYAVHFRSNDAERRELEGVLRIAYRAPEDLLVEFVQGDDRARTIISSGMMAVDFRKNDKTIRRGEADSGVHPSEARERIAHAFHEQFPALGDVGGADSPEVFLRFRFKAGTEKERPEFNLEGGTGRGAGPLLAWLETVKPALEGDAVLWNPAEGIRVFLRKDTGFIEKVVATYQGETKTALELKDLALDGEVAAAEFRMPPADPSIEDISESLSRSSEVPRFVALRSTMLRKIHDAAEAGTLEWTSETRANFGKVLRTFHEELAPLLAAATVRWASSNVDKFCGWYQDTKKASPASDGARSGELESKQIDWEKRFRETLEKAIEPYLARAVPETDEAKATKISGETRTLELEVAKAACRKTVVEPALEYMTQQMELARRGELPPTKAEKR